MLYYRLQKAGLHHQSSELTLLNKTSTVCHGNYLEKESNEKFDLVVVNDDKCEASANLICYFNLVAAIRAQPGTSQTGSPLIVLTTYFTEVPPSFIDCQLLAIKGIWHSNRKLAGMLEHLR